MERLESLNPPILANTPAKNPFENINLAAAAATAAPTPVAAPTGDYDSTTKERLDNLEKAWEEHYALRRHSKRDWTRDIFDHREYKRRILAAATSRPKRQEITAPNDALKPDLVPADAKPKGSFGSTAPTAAPAAAVTPTFSFGSAPPMASTAEATTPSFSFGAPVPGATAGVAPSFSFGAAPPQALSASAPKPFGSFAFGSSAPSQATAAARPMAFSFGSVVSVGDSAPGAETEDDAMPKEEPSKVEAIADPHWKDIYSFHAKYYKYAENEWKSYCRALVKVEVHRENGKKRMVMRDGIGKVQLNLSLAKGMKFQSVPKGKKTFIRFTALQDPVVGPENFMYQVKPAVMEEAVAELNRLAE
jgi:hypothetical protein